MLAGSKKDQEIEMFGITIKQMQLEQSSFYDNLLWAMSILSDAQ